MFDWISKLFGGGNQQKSSSPKPQSRPQPNPLTQMPSMGSSRPMVDLAAQAREEERRRREEERKAKQAADAAKKVKEQAEAKAKQEQQKPQKTVNPMANGDMFSLNMKPQVPQKRTVQVGNNPVNMSQQQLDVVRKNPNAPYAPEIHAAAKLGKEPTKLEAMKIKMDQNAADTRKAKVNSAKASMLANQIGGVLQAVPRETANLPAFGADILGWAGINKKGMKQFSEDWTALTDEGFNQLKMPGGKSYNEVLQDTERAQDANFKAIYENGGRLNEAEMGSLAFAEGLASLVSPTEAGVGIKAVSRVSRPVQESKIFGTADTIGESTRLRQITTEAERVAQEAEEATSRLPDQVQIEKQAAEAGRIDDGVSSPSRVEQVQSNLTQHVEQQKAEIQSRYERTLMGLNELADSMTPRPLATQLAGTPDPMMMARQADAPSFDPPQQLTPLDDLAVPSKTPIAQAMDSPNEAASKAAADAAPAPAPENVVKTRTLEDMDDAEIARRFNGATREQKMAEREAALAEREAEKADKAERAKAKTDRKAQRAAAQEQAAIDAGEAPAKTDLFAGKRRTTAGAPAETKPSSKAATKERQALEDNFKSVLDGGKTPDDVIASFKDWLKNPDNPRFVPQVEANIAKLERLKQLRDGTPAPKTAAKKDLFAGKRRDEAPAKEAPANKESNGWTTTKNKDGENVDTKTYDSFTGGTVTKNVTHFKTGGTMSKYTANKAGGKTREFTRLGDAKNWLAKPANDLPSTASVRLSKEQKALDTRRAENAKTVKAADPVDDDIPTPDDVTDFSAPKTTADNKKDLFAGKRRTTKDAKGTGQKHTSSPNQGKTKFVAGAKGVEAEKPSKTPTENKNIFTGEGDSPQKKMTQAQRDAANKLGRENRKKAKAEGKDKVAAKKLTSARARQTVGETGDEGTTAATARAFTAHNTKINIAKETADAAATVEKVSDNKILQFAEDTLTDGKTADSPQYMFMAEAIVKRLDVMRREGKIDYDDMINVAAKLEQSLALRASKSGQTQRITRELYKNVPAPIRVKKELEKMKAHFEDVLKKEFTYTKADEAELLKHTDAFDNAAQKLEGAEAKMDTTMSKMLDPENKLSDADLDKLDAEFKQAAETRKQAQKDALKASQDYKAKMDSLKPPLTGKEKFQNWALGAPDSMGNYLRMSMLSAPSGRIRDVFSTTFNVVDQVAWRTIEAVTGKLLNKTTGTNLLSSMGSNASRKKGTLGSWDKLKASWRGEYTLDEATGRAEMNDRSELKGKDSIYVFGNKVPTKSKGGMVRGALGLPKKLVTTTVQASTDLSYGIYTDRLYANGLKAANAAGLTGKQAKKYAEMYMERPDLNGRKDAARIWLENSGMHDNFISKNLTRLTDALDTAGSGKGKGKGKGDTESVKVRFLKKAVARTIRTTTIPFVQYLGGATHAMFVHQNPVVNFSKAIAAGVRKDPQAAIENLSRGGWNTVKIGTLTSLIGAGVLEMSDTDADGKSQYNGPYVVHNGTYVPASTYGIAAGSAIISAHYIQKALDSLQEGDIAGAMANSTVGPWWATLQASGMDNMLSGSTILAGLPASLSQVAQNSSKSATDIAATITGGVIGDIGTQGVPAILRDIDAFLNKDPNYNPTGEAPDTSGKDANGRVNPIQKGIAQVKAGIPFLSADLPRKSGKQAKSFTDRIFNANTQSEQQAAAVKKTETEKQNTITRANSLFEDPDITSLLSDEQKAIHDKYKGKLDNASKEDMDKMWKGVKDSKDRLMDDGKFTAHGKILRYELEEMKAAGKSSSVDIAKHERKTIRSELAGKNNIRPDIFRMYTGDDTAEGGGISQSEFNKMVDPDDPSYTPEGHEIANLLAQLDAIYTEAGVSSNTNGVDPWKSKKYKLPSDYAAEKAAKGGGGGSKNLMATDVGILKMMETEDGGNGLKYKTVSGVPNIMATTPRKNFKKTISIKRGVQL